MVFKLKRRLARMLYGEYMVEAHFNVPIKLFENGSYLINERIVENPFVFSQLSGSEPCKILDFGCTRSWLAVSLASMGHRVHAVDLRPYPLNHDNLTFAQQNILSMQEKGFDVITAVSVLEHVGLGAYNEAFDPGALDGIVTKMCDSLVDGGRFIVTVPVGKASVDDLLRSFAPGELEGIIISKGMELILCQHFRRVKQNQWMPCSREEIGLVSNHRNERLKFGANGLGCMVFGKPAKNPMMVNE